jgi:signal transduction histidine kinase
MLTAAFSKWRRRAARWGCLGIRIIGNRLRLSLADDGSGLESARPTAGMDGLANMRVRLEEMGGRFAIASQAGRGTIPRFYPPLN